MIARNLKKLRGSISVTIDADIDLNDVAEALDAEAILTIADYHGVDIADNKQVVAQAITAIRIGHTEDGITALERHFFPTFESRSACEEAYRSAMAMKEKGANS